jgi:hypothetical protein
MRLSHVLFFIVAFFAVRAAYRALSPQDLSPTNGMAALPPPSLSEFPGVGKVPNQATCPPHKWGRQNFVFTAAASYAVTARVASIARYRLDPESSLAPYDFTLAWGEMDDIPLLESMSISQSGRWFMSQMPRNSKVTLATLVQNIANTHLIPMNEEIWDKLAAVDKYDLVRMRGYLVNIIGPDGWHWGTSMSRNDRGGGSCEVFWVEAVEVLP